MRGDAKGYRICWSDKGPAQVRISVTTIGEERNFLNHHRSNVLLLRRRIYISLIRSKKSN